MKVSIASISDPLKTVHDFAILATLEEKFIVGDEIYMYDDHHCMPISGLIAAFTAVHLRVITRNNCMLTEESLGTRLVHNACYNYTVFL